MIPSIPMPELILIVPGIFCLWRFQNGRIYRSGGFTDYCVSRLGSQNKRASLMNKGQALFEYMLILGLIGVVAITALTVLSGVLGDFMAALSAYVVAMTSYLETSTAYLESLTSGIPTPMP